MIESHVAEHKHDSEGAGPEHTILGLSGKARDCHETKRSNMHSQERHDTNQDSEREPKEQQDSEKKFKEQHDSKKKSKEWDG